MLELKNVSKTYTMGSHSIHALDQVSIKIEAGDFVAIMGPSGSGKSTLMHVMGLLDVPSQGSYLVDNIETAHMSEDELAELRRQTIGFIFQQFNLLPRISAKENVALPLIYSQNQLDFKQATRVLTQVGLASRSEHKPNEMSGGQQQRVAIARSLINQPKILFADEPTGNLDSQSEKEVLGILKDLNKQGITIIIVTHEEEIGHQAHRLIRMRDGKIQSDERLKDFHRSNPHPEKFPKESSKKSFGNLWQHAKMAFKTLASNKVRTSLSILGIMIGVAAVIAMMALGRGAQQAIKEQLSSLGSNLLILRTGAVRSVGGAILDAGAVTRLTLEDARLIKDNVAHVKSTAGNLNGRGQVAYQNKNWATSISGVSETYAETRALSPTLGRFFTESEIATRARVAVIGATLVRELFDKKNPIGETIKVNRVAFQVIGILPEKGSNGFQDQDDRMMIPVTTAMYRVFGKPYLDNIDIEVTDATQTEFVQEAIQELMLSKHRIPPSQQSDAYQVRNMAEIQEALSSTTRIMTLLLSVIAAISLIVGGIGIMNIMLVSVTERTREIGLRKAIGAKRKDILNQFLIESVVMSLIGGVSGITLAWITATLISTLSGWATSITFFSVALAFGFSTFIGVLFGLYPARKASRLAPIDALRYE